MPAENETSTGAVATAPPPNETPEPTKKRGPNRVLLIGVLALVALVSVLYYIYSQTYETTDDAQVDGHLVPIASRVDGSVTAVNFENNQSVKAGQTLIELDPKDNQVAIAQAQAQYDQSLAQVSASHPNVPITRASNVSDLASAQAEVANADAALAAAQHDYDSDVAKLKQAQATSDRNQADFQRYATLFAKQEVSKSDYDQYRATADAQASAVVASQAEVASAQKTIDQRKAQLLQQQAKLRQTQTAAPLQLQIREADIKTSQASAEASSAMLDQARLNLGYTKIAAPIDGVVTQRGVEIGSRVSTGQQLMMIVQINDLWVTANFKETQLARMHPGQKVKIHVDALKQDFDATIESMPAATGSVTSVLPPENATGNFVKVVQRLPVRIHFNPGQKDLDKLRPGMSVEPHVYL